MIERGSGAALAFESLAPFRVGGELLGEDLDRNRAIEARISRPVHLAHAACANQAENFIGAEANAGGERRQFVN